MPDTEPTMLTELKQLRDELIAEARARAVATPVPVEPPDLEYTYLPDAESTPPAYNHTRGDSALTPCPICQRAQDAAATPPVLCLHPRTRAYPDGSQYCSECKRIIPSAVVLYDSRIEEAAPAFQYQPLAPEYLTTRSRYDELLAAERQRDTLTAAVRELCAAWQTWIDVKGGDLRDVHRAIIKLRELSK